MLAIMQTPVMLINVGLIKTLQKNQNQNQPNQHEVHKRKRNP